ncbi:MAG: hypothetical protein WAW37_19460 [Syntrophobacteraceae bacterium]
MKFWRILVICFVIFSVSSCSVYMAAHQPGQKDMTVLKSGIHQSVVRTEMGTPVWTGKENEQTVDIFRFTQGYSQGEKTGRAVFHGAADVLTLGLWEVVGTPVESIASGDQYTVKVFYDDNSYVTRVDTKKEIKSPQAPPPEPEGEQTMQGNRHL